MNERGNRLDVTYDACCDLTKSCSLQVTLHSLNSATVWVHT